jgi:ABC-type multidrug transport system fused ATPase/permease subunit
MARPGAGQAELVKAAQHAQLHEFIESLPEGYDTTIGEQGLKLSGGQRQRLAIARALLQDALILILDEPTANLDALTEREVMQALRALMAGRTTLLITHRLAGLEAMDEILVLCAGRVVERGTHHDLWQAGGLYRRMADLQRQVLADQMDTKAQPLG